MEVFYPVEQILTQKVVKDFFREGWVEKAKAQKPTEDLEEEEELMEEEVEEGTLVEVAGLRLMIPAEEGVVLSTLERIRKMNVVTKRPAMAR